MKTKLEVWNKVIGKLVDDMGISDDIYSAYRLGFEDGMKNTLSNKK